MTFLHSLQRQSTPTVLTSCHSTTTSQCTIPSLHITTYAFFPPTKTPFSSPSRLLFKAHLKPTDMLSTLMFAYIYLDTWIHFLQPSLNTPCRLQIIQYSQTTINLSFEYLQKLHAGFMTIKYD